MELNAARGSSGFGPLPIGYEAILAWTTLTGTIIRPSEVEALRRLDALWITESGKKKPQPPEGGTS